MTNKAKLIETIELAHTWESLVPAFIMLIENGNAEGRKTAIEEITRMAKIADIAVADAKAKAIPEEDPEPTPEEIEEAERLAYADYAAEQRACGYEVLSRDEWAGRGTTARQNAHDWFASRDPDDPDY